MLGLLERGAHQLVLLVGALRVPDVTGALREQRLDPREERLEVGAGESVREIFL